MGQICHGALWGGFVFSSPPSHLTVLLFIVPGAGERKRENNSLGRKDRVRAGREDGGGSSDLQIIYLRLASA